MSLQGLWEPFASADRSAVSTSASADNEHPRPTTDKNEVEDIGASAGAQHACDTESHVADASHGVYSCIHRIMATDGKAAVLDLIAVETHLAVALPNGAAETYTVSDDGKLHSEGTSKGSQSISTPALLVKAAGNVQALISSNEGISEVDLFTASSNQVLAARPTYKHEGNLDIICAAISPDGHYLAAGAQGALLLFNCKTSELVVSFDETHKEAVSQVVWAPNSACVLISASDDGLVTIFDFKDGVDEDDSWKAALNLEGAVARMGFYGSSSEKLWMVSQTAGLHLWAWHDACCEDGPGGESTLADFHDARPDLAAAALQSNQETSADAPPHAYDYLIACHFDQHSDKLMLAAGSNDGSCAVFSVSEPSTTTSASIGPVVAWMKGSHTDAIRGIAWLPNNMVVTGGDDGQICLWESCSRPQRSKGKKRKL